MKNRECLTQFIDEAGTSSRYACAGAGVAHRTDVVVSLRRLQANGQWAIDHDTDPLLPRMSERVAPQGLWVVENRSNVPTKWRSAAWARTQIIRNVDASASGVGLVDMVSGEELQAAHAS